MVKGRPASTRGSLQFGCSLVREKAGEGLSKVANGFGLCLFLPVAAGARDPTEERGVAKGVEGIGQRLGLTGGVKRKTKRKEQGKEQEKEEKRAA